MTEDRESKEIRTLLPGETYKLSDGREISISPVPFGKIRRYTEKLVSLSSRMASIEGLDLDDPASLVILFDFAFEEVVDVMALILDKEREWFDTIAVGDGVGIMLVMIQQNFNESTKKNVLALVEMIKLASQTSSKPSSGGVIVGGRSKDTPSAR